MWIELLITKDEALFYNKIKERAEVDQEGRLKSLRTNRGGEFNSSQFSIFCSDQGIMHYTTTPYSPQQNGVVERRNESVVEMARCMLKKGCPSKILGRGSLYCCVFAEQVTY
jgi:transposase InsO family protein